MKNSGASEGLPASELILSFFVRPPDAERDEMGRLTMAGFQTGLGRLAGVKP